MSKKTILSKVLNESESLNKFRLRAITSPRERLPCRLANLDRLTNGGLPWGSLIEWGTPLHLGGRDVVLQYVKAATNEKKLCLWVSSHHDLLLYPSACFGRGVDMEYLYVADTLKPMQTLKPLFQDPTFRLIILDGSQLRNEEYSYLARKARQYDQIIMVLKSTALSQVHGNVWARYRFNLDRRDSNNYEVKLLKGASHRKCLIHFNPQQAAEI